MAKYTFKLLRGSHHQTDLLTGKPREYNSRDPNNCIVEANIDLEQKFGSEKFDLRFQGFQIIRRRVKKNRTFSQLRTF